MLFHLSAKKQVDIGQFFSLYFNTTIFHTTKKIEEIPYSFAQYMYKEVYRNKKHPQIAFIECKVWGR